MLWPQCCAFFLGGKSEDFKQTRWAFHEGMRNFSPETFSSLQRGIKEECPKPTLKVRLQQALTVTP